jgi:hypothetical protein
MKRHILDYDPHYNNASSPEDLGTTPSPEINPVTGKAWTWIEKLLGVANQGVDVLNKYKTGTVQTSNGPVSTTVGRAEAPQGPTFLGMPRTIGIGLTVVVVGLIGFSIYKMNKK